MSEMEHCIGKKCDRHESCYRYLVDNKIYSGKFLRASIKSSERCCEEKLKNIKKVVTRV